MKQIKDDVVLLPNIGSAQEFASELYGYLDGLLIDFDTQAMNEHGLFLQGQKDMLGQIVSLLKEQLVVEEDEKERAS